MNCVNVTEEKGKRRNSFHSIEPDSDGEGFGVSLVEVTDVKIVNNFGVCPFPDQNILVYKNNLSRNNKYPVGNPEYEQGTYGDILCLEWPCGEHKACVRDDFDKSVKICEQ